MDGFQAAAVATDAQRVLDGLREARERTLDLVAPFSDEELEREVAIRLLTGRRRAHRTPGGLRPAPLSLERHTEPMRMRRPPAIATHQPVDTEISSGGEPG